MSNVTRLPDPAMLRMLPTCPPPLPPAPLTPPSLASTGTGDLVAFPDLLDQPAPDETPALRVVPRPRHRAARAPFVTLVLLLLGGGLVSLLLINTALSQGAFAVQKLQRDNVALTEQQQELSKALADADQPESLAHKAVQLGMVPGGAPAFLHLPDGKVAGTPAVATSPPPPAPPAPTTTPAPATTAPATTAPATTAPATTAPVTSAAVTSGTTATKGASPTGKATGQPTSKATGQPTGQPTGKATGTATGATHTPTAGRTTPKGKP